MFCPNCKCEYLPGVKECADCGVPLVAALDSSVEDSSHKNDVLVAIWAGNEPGECTAIKQALENAGIPFTDKNSSLNFIFPSMGNKYEVWVPSLAREEAQKIVLDLEGRIDPAELTPEEFGSLALPVSDEVDPDQDTTTLSDTPDDWDGEVAVREVWSGEKEDFADTLVACLREIGVPSRKLGEAGRWRLLVRSDQEARATEIVREVVEASPPQ
jgi:hypothetical protein